MTAVSLFWVLCVHVVIVSTWKLLTRVRDDRIFSAASLPWVDAIVGSVLVAWVGLLGVFLYVGVHADDPGLPLLLLLMSVGVAVPGLPKLGDPALLRQATTLRSELEAVI